MASPSPRCRTGPLAPVLERDGREILRGMVSVGWKSLPYDDWHATLDTLHAHAAAPGQAGRGVGSSGTPAPTRCPAGDRPRLGDDAAPAPDGSGALVVALDLQRHESVIEHSDGRVERVPLTPNRSVGEVSRDVLSAITEMVGPVQINPTPQEVPWTAILNEDEEHKTLRTEPGRRIFRSGDPCRARCWRRSGRPTADDALR